MQLQAGYILEDLINLFAGSQQKKVIKLTKALSYFELITENDLSIKNPDPFAVTIHNMLLRGLPTLAPSSLEDLISATFLQTKKNLNKDGSFNYSFLRDELKDEIFRALHIIDPRLSLKDLKQIIKFENDPEEKLKQQLLFEIIPAEIGPHILQLFEFNRSFESIFKLNNPKILNKLQKFNLHKKTLDFTLELPYENENNLKGLAIEIEKKLLEDDEVISLLDKNQLLNQIAWTDIIFLKQSDFYSAYLPIQPLIDFSYSSYFEVIRKNYERPLYKTDSGLTSIQIALTPFEVARIERVILAYILANRLDLTKEKIEIAVIERDVPGAFLAVQHLQQQFNHLYALAGTNMVFPKLELILYYSEDFENADFNILFLGEKYPINEFDPERKFDLVIDSSILRFKGLDKEYIKTNNENLAIVRSAKYPNSKPQFINTQPIKFKKFIGLKPKNEQEQKEIEKRYEAFYFFLKNIFRFYQLSEKQELIISNLLAGEKTVANLPYTYRKSLIYKIAALLNSGFTLVVEPTYNILIDQINSFQQFWIDAIKLFIEPNLDNNNHNIDNLLQNEYLILFISGESFHYNSFRNLLKQFQDSEKYFNLIVIDEIQAISPWAHNFNYGYFSLSNNIKNLLPKAENYNILGLTSGTSYDVIVDISQEFNIKLENFIHENFDFNNIELKITPIDEKQSLTERKLKPEEIEQKKFDFIIKNNLLNNNTLVFSITPEQLANQLNQNIYDKNIEAFNPYYNHRLFQFNLLNSYLAAKKFSEFKDDQIDVLVANRMINFGLDKPNIRNLIVHHLPLGVTDLYYLLTRIGRDRDKASATIILSQTYVYFDRLTYLVSANQLAAVRETREIPYDQYINLKLLEKITGNLRKDFNNIDEILNQTSSSEDTLESLIIKKVKLIFNKWVYFDTQPIEDPTQLHVYLKEDNEYLGYIDYEKDKIIIQADAIYEFLAEKILKFIDKEIRISVPKPIEIFKILKEKISTPQTNTIVHLLVNLKVGQKTSKTIDFCNNIPKQLIELLNIQNATEQEIIDILENTFSFDEFIKKLRDYAEKRTIRRMEEKIEDLYYKYRNYQDTYKIIYYLYATGVIADYLIDFNNMQFIVVIQKLSDEEYLNRIYRRILRYISKDRAIEVFEKIPRFEGTSLVQKTTNYWAFFEHTFIQKKAFHTLTELDLLIKEYLQNKNQQNLKNYLKYYFSAKYLTDIKHRIQSNESCLKISDYFLKKAGVFKDNWYHIYNSAVIILKENPDSPTAKMLRGWSSLILFDDDEKISKALDDIVYVLLYWKEKHNIQIPDFVKKIDEIFNQLESVNFDLRAKVEQLIQLKLITVWLENFNKKLLAPLNLKTNENARTN